MPTLVFPERDTLRLVLASGVVAAPVMQALADAGWDEHGRLWLTTNSPLSRAASVALQRLGVRIVGTSAVTATENVRCWQQLWPLEKTASLGTQSAGVVQFELPGGELSSLVGEIERCGAGQWSIQWLDDIANASGADRVLLRTVAPPYFTLLKIADSNSVSAYVEQAPSVWIALGWHHLFASQIQVPAGKMLLLRPPRIWEWRDSSVFDDVPAQHTFSQPTGNKPVSSRVANIAIPVRLVANNDSAPAEMWLIRDEALRWLERFLQSFDERFLQRFTCAVANFDGNLAIVLRVRGKGPVPILVEAPLGFRPFLKLANLFVPCGYEPAPALRRDTVRQLLAADPARLTWLRRLDDGAFTTESVAMSAFRPLTEFLEYRVESAERALRPWQQSAAIAFERFVERPPEPAVHAPQSRRAAQAKKSVSETPRERVPVGRWLASRLRSLFRSKSKRDQPAPPLGEDSLAPIPIDDALRTVQSAAQPRSIEHSLRIDEARASARALTAQFHESIEDFTPALRLELWPKLAAAFAHANLPSEAALCWLNALWEPERPLPLWAWGWLKAEAAQAGWNPHQVDLKRWLDAPADKFRPRAVAAYALWATLQNDPPPGFVDAMPRLNNYLDAHESHLPIRAVWLVRTSLARSGRGDVLALAHARDRLFGRLRERGLSLASDVPSFVRNVGADDPERLNQVARWLAAKHKTIGEWIASLAMTEPHVPSATPLPHLPYLDAEIPCTRAYADLMIAWGLSRLGEYNEADRLREIAHQSLPNADPIHHVLRSAFDFRLLEARENQTANAQPPAWRNALEALGRNERYKVDWLLHRSRILEPLERIDPRWASTMRHYHGWNELQRQLIDLPGLEGGDLQRRVKLLIERSDREEATQRSEILLAILRLANRVDRASIEIALEHALSIPISSPEHMRRIVDSGLHAAAALGLDTKVRLFAHRFAGFVEEQKGQGSHELFAGLTGATFRCLRKFGLKEEADSVLSKIALWLTRGKDLATLRRERASDWTGLLRTLLHVAAGWYFCGRSTQGHRIIEEARTKDLFDSSSRFYDHRALGERAALAIVYAGTIGQIPAKLALGYFDELFGRLKYIAVSGWNTHYTLQPLELIDTVIRAVVSDDFSLGPSVRGWLDDDEFNVRQRIHREMTEWLAQQGVA
jgi:FtsH ternary system domain X7